MYVADALKAISENTAHSVRNGEPMIWVEKRYSEIIGTSKKKEEKIDHRTCAEIAADIWKNARIGKRKNGTS